MFNCSNTKPYEELTNSDKCFLHRVREVLASVNMTVSLDYLAGVMQDERERMKRDAPTNCDDTLFRRIHALENPRSRRVAQALEERIIDTVFREMGEDNPF